MMIDATSSLRSGRARLLELLSSLASDEWALSTECPAWTVKGLALHLLGDDLSLLSRQRDGEPSGLLTYAADHPGGSFMDLLDGFNEQWVTGTSFLSPPLVIELLEHTGEATATYYETLDPDDPGEPVFAFGSTGEPSPWWQVIAREYAERWIHQSQLRRALERPPLDGGLTDLGVEVAATALAMSTDGLGSMVVGERRFGDGPGALVEVDPDRAPLVLSRGLDVDATVAALSGDDELVSAVARTTSR